MINPVTLERTDEMEVTVTLKSYTTEFVQTMKDRRGCTIDQIINEALIEYEEKMIERLIGYYEDTGVTSIPQERLDNRERILDYLDLDSWDDVLETFWGDITEETVYNYYGGYPPEEWPDAGMKEIAELLVKEIKSSEDRQ